MELWIVLCSDTVSPTVMMAKFLCEIADLKTGEKDNNTAQNYSQTATANVTCLPTGVSCPKT